MSIYLTRLLLYVVERSIGNYRIYIYFFWPVFQWLTETSFAQNKSPMCREKERKKESLLKEERGPKIPVDERDNVFQ